MLRKFFIISFMALVPYLTLISNPTKLEDCPKTQLSGTLQTYLPGGHEMIQFRLAESGCQGDYEPFFITSKWGEHHCRQIKDLQYRVRILEDLVETMAKRYY